ncbi:N-acetylmuramoyl-L-alanine amidase [Emcibacter nanhaiensis]|uniref:N-acetylmuramoyl-L-alanine amidase n=1 Tax=Emcibacter nanhaiensis TaxID=1505037 RepID=A0A501PR15_9PROT|nr:N-acetylmuramoyl-L-alanine amidase [Emcibacter nanhaiensis]TPD62969.1 N-acetylmuramoyl-L-alanine amidase [Emcibacter nanhaiensis]
MIFNKTVSKALLLFCLLISYVFGGSYAFSAVPEVTAARIGEHKGRTRFVLEMSKKVDFSIFTLADPNRIVIDIAEVEWKIGPGGADGDGFIARYRYGLFKQGTSRIVLDLKSPVKVDKSFFLPPTKSKPYRFVIDLRKISQKEFAGTIRKPRQMTAATRPPQPVVESTRSGRTKKLIVLDPGHGGHDPGNLGKNGSSAYPEKTVALTAARTIKQELERTGRYEVILTRDRDIYVKHRARSHVAHAHQADLFISVHCDSIADSRVRGATVYTLSEKASDREAAALAARENKSDIIAGMDLEAEPDEVQGILIELLQRETMNLSSSFATELVGQLRQSTLLRTRPHRTANLLVLKGLDVPSVLLELGYLTNSNDARLLMQKETQQKIGRSIVSAVDRYFQKNFASN